MARQINPGYVLAVVIAQTLHARDPGFLRALRSNLAAMQQRQPPGEMTWDTLRIFLSALDDPEIFPDGRS